MSRRGSFGFASVLASRLHFGLWARWLEKHLIQIRLLQRLMFVGYRKGWETNVVGTANFTFSWRARSLRA